MSGIAPITYVEMHAWQKMTKSKPTPEEVKLLTTLDNLYRETLENGPGIKD